MHKIAVIAGARPNFMKIAPLCQELKKRHLDFFLVNTGQHFSPEMADDFLIEFDLQADYNIQPSQDNVVSQFGDIMKGLEQVFVKQKPTLVIVVGDVNSTLAAALVAHKMGIKLAHIEAGLRSFNKAMPEEHNRIMTDYLSDYLFASEIEGVKNLQNEGITNNVFLTGNIMIDTLMMFLPKIKQTDEKFYFCTLHRGENVDNKQRFSQILDALEAISAESKIYLPLHPRTKKMAEQFGLLSRIGRIFQVIKPLNYCESLYYQKNAQLVLTDSGGIQEESSFLNTPCLTLRTETERPITVEQGTAKLAGVTRDSIINAYQRRHNIRKKSDIKLWDGKTSARIVDILIK